MFFKNVSRITSQTAERVNKFLEWARAYAVSFGRRSNSKLAALKKTIKSASDKEFLPWTNAIVLFKKLHIIL